MEALMGRNYFERKFSGGFLRFYRYDTNIFPQYFCFTHQFVSSENPLFNLAFGLFLKSNLLQYGNSVKEHEYIRRILLKQTLKEVVSDPRRKAVFTDVFKSKSGALFSSLAGLIGNDTYNIFIQNYLEEQKFSISLIFDIVS